MDSREDTAEAVGCPIRKSPDQRALASPRSLSQRATSFIASRRQGIHQMPFVHYNTSPRPSRKTTPRDLRSRGDPGPRIAQRSARRGPIFAEAGQHTHAVEHAHTILSRKPEPEGPGQGQRSTGACPRSLARHSPCHPNDPNLRHREGFRLPASFPCRPVAGMAGAMVGPGRFERPTSPLSGVRSNQLSYWPGTPENGTTTQAGKADQLRVPNGRDLQATAPLRGVMSEPSRHESRTSFRSLERR